MTDAAEYSADASAELTDLQKAVMAGDFNDAYEDLAELAGGFDIFNMRKLRRRKRYASKKAPLPAWMTDATLLPRTPPGRAP